MKRHAFVVLAAGMLTAGCGAGPDGVAPSPLGHEHGIEIIRVQVLAGGDLARLDYRVRDIMKARETLSGDVRLVAEAGGTLPVLSVGRLGPMKQRPSPSGKLQFILFTNPGRALQKGGTAALDLGGGRVGGIPVS